MTAIETPFARYEGVVKPDWIDGNGHMNLAYYVVLFDEASDLFYAEWDLDWAYTKRTNMGMFAVETHMLYEQELVEGDRVRVTSWVLGIDAKRVHVAEEMYRPDGARAACWEGLLLHVDLGIRKVVPWPDTQRRRAEEWAAMHATTPAPDWVGRKVSMRR